MARKVNLRFGGQKALADWSAVQVALQLYLDIADQYGLTKLAHGFQPVANTQTGAIVGVIFWYDKLGIPETALSTFNETWYDLTQQYGFTRNETQIEYYEG